MRCSFRGRRCTLVVSIVIWHGRRSTLDVSCCVFFANRIGRAASSGDRVRIPWQAWHFVRCAENWRKPRTKHRFWGSKFSGSKALRRTHRKTSILKLQSIKIGGSLARNARFAPMCLVSRRRRVYEGSCKTSPSRRFPTVKIGGSLARNARFDVPASLVLSLWFSCCLAVSMGENAKPLLFECFQAGCHVVLRGRRGNLWHSNLFDNVSKVSKLEEVSHEMLVLLRPRVLSRVSGFPVASPCLWGKLHNLSFSKVFKQVAMSFWRTGVAFCDIPTCFIPCRKFFCVAGAARHSTLYTLNFTLYTFHCTLYTPHFPLCTPHFTLYTPHSTLHTPPHSTLLAPHFTFHTPHFTLHTPHVPLHTPHSTLYTPHSTIYTLDSSLYTLHSSLHTLHSTLYTPHSKLYTLHSTLYTLHSTLLHFTLNTLHSSLLTPHSTLYTLHCALYTPHSTLYTLYTLHTLHFTHSTRLTPHFTLLTPHFTLHTLSKEV